MNASSSKLRRRLLLGTAPLLVAALALTGCGRATGPEAAGPEVNVDDSAASGTIEFWAGGADGEALPPFLTTFEEANPDVKINVTQIPEPDFDAKLTAAIASGTVPDLVYLYSQTQSTLFNTKGFSPVPKGLVDSASFFESSYDATLVDGVSYAVPWYNYSSVFMYRSDIAEAAGVEAPTTWDEMKTFAAAVQKQGVDNGVGLDVGYDGYTAQNLNILVHQNGGSLISDDLKTWTLNTPKNVEALEFWGSLFADGYASPDTPTFLDTVPFFSSGKIAGLTTGPWFPGWLNDANGAGWTDDNLGVVVPPAGPAGSVGALGGGSLAVLKDAKNADGAWKLVRWLSEPDVQGAWYDAFGNLPAVMSAWDTPSIANDPNLGAVKEAIKTSVTTPQVPGWGQVGSILGAQMERVARGSATAQQALDEAQSQAESIPTGIK